MLGKAKNHCFLCSAVERHKFRGATLLKVASLDFAEDDELIKEIKADYDFIRNKLIAEGFSALTGTDGKWIQARTKGAGHGSTSRAFYARTSLVKRIFEIAS
ncbi:MAG: hypothetical protein A3C58_00430 [Candidatus Staskawiczbacteria bacterium RIFCSPHIGHO2_02_FULL_34_10]|uniref:DNA mismatch repair MutH/Type II restriction enzyme Sau3AI domain-containing protein n=1 Tax=Candidatus Staskawiczbacteria bacterium RIFCSPHIGHO2_02_FULL_34_10 TaxID=1802205 RepID=A0A1G2HWW2_9BACT|nr:MAG: hypothetical protein A3C58_00430 [Candidatus Staskawiczbacteria bacterium RIFCSPHIGHO2_02_FULL_34_10]